MNKFWATVVLFLITPFLVMAQKPKVEKFSSKDMMEFNKQVKKYLSDNNKGMADEWEKKVEKINALSNDKLHQMADIFNYFDQVNYHAQQYTQYVAVVLAFVEAKGDAGLFAKFNEMLPDVIKGQKTGIYKDFNAYINFAKVFLGNGNVKETGGLIWRCESENFDFTFDNEPKLIYKKCHVLITGIGDTVTIKNTSGEWLILKEKFIGNAGSIDWQKAGIDSEMVYCVFKKFVVDANKSEIIIDSAKLFHKQYLSAPLLGKLTDKISNRKPGTPNTSYPKFASAGYYELQDISKGVKYKGGFGIAGNRVIGTGVNGKAAEIKFYNNKEQLVALATSNEFVIKKGEEIISTNAIGKMLIEKDSIFHPGCELRFDINHRVLKLARGEMGIAKIAFVDSYHKTETNAEAVVWCIDSTQINFVMIAAAGKIPASFESYNYFEKNRLDKYTNVADFNPLMTIISYCDKNKTREVDADVIAKQMNPNYDEGTIKRTLYNLTEEGFIFYSEYRHLVVLKDKGATYVKANKKFVDYDNIKIKSESANGRSAQIDMTTNNIKINGIKSFSLSDSNQVTIFPSYSSVVMKKGRDMDFGGSMYGGHLDFLGRNFAFDYNKFKVGITTADSMMIYLGTGKMDDDGVHEQLRRTGTFICGISGDLMIDGPFNKSTRVKLPSYPKLFSTQNSYAYYDDEKIHHHAYNKAKFYFKLDTFSMDSLNTFTKNQVHFSGVMNSGGIFPEFNETLRLQPDYSLGFKSSTPTIGYPLYTDKGNYKGGISLSNAGLQGNGEIEFQASKQQSTNILFAPDSLNAKSEAFQQEATTSPEEFPAVTNTNVFTHWLPAQDRMEVKMDTTPFNMFGNVAKHKGGLIISPKGMTGYGILDWPEASLNSQLMKYGKMNVNADTSGIQIKTSDGNIAFKAPDVNSKIDFEKRTGDFISNTKELTSNFVYNQYLTSINQFHWDMDKKTLDFISPPGDTAIFLSQNPAQNGLKFVGKNARYNLSNYMLNVTGIPYINSGDSRIMPDSGQVMIEPKAVMQTLKNAKIVSDSVHQFHNIYDATVKIFSRNSYLCTDAKYDFNSKITGKQVLLVDTLTMDDYKGKEMSVGFSNIKEENNFALNPKMNFKGYFRFNASERDPSLDGFARLKLKSTTIPTEWFSLNSVIKADSGTFNVVNAKNEKGNPLYFGILRSTYDSVGVYPAIFASASTPNDAQIFVPQGTLEYNGQTNDLTYGLGTKIRGESNTGDFVRFNDNTNKMYCDGKFSLGYNYPGIKVFAAGNATYDLNRNAIVMNAVVGLKIDFSKDLYNILVKEQVDLLADKDAIDYKKNLPFYEKAFSEYLTPKEVTKAFKNIKEQTDETAETPKLEYPKNTPFNLTFTDVKLMYDPFTASWKGNCPVGILNINETFFGKKIYAYMEFGGKRGDDFFNIYFEASEADWNCYMYRGHVLKMISSNDAFNEAINKIEPVKRKVTPDVAKPTEFYTYQIGSDVLTKQFKERLRTFKY
ncbi:MAG: hypothetical protein RIQ33_1947 [Bacteroidota bacterium]|jgi:hypothetical protein